MNIKTTIFAVFVALVLVACEDTSTTVISTRTAVTSFYLYSPFSSSVKKCVFTIDTIEHVIYNEDSLDFGTRLDSLAPIMAPTFITAKIDDTISLYDKDTVYVDFTFPRRLTVKSSTGDTATYLITVNVHSVDPDSFTWYRVYDLGLNVIDRQGAAMMDDGEMYWLTKRYHRLAMSSSMDGESWISESVDGLPSNVDVEHLVAGSETLYAMQGNDLYLYDGTKWSKTTTTSDIGLRHLLMCFKGDLYALGKGNVILKLVGSSWKTAAEMGSGFPVEGESAIVGKTRMGRDVAYIAFGIDEQGNYLRDVWSTENGTYWVKLTEKVNSLSTRAYSMVRQYGKGLLALGGWTEDSVVTDRFMFSKDYGMTWENGDTLYKFDPNQRRRYSERFGGTMMVNDLGRVYVIGGRDKFGTVFGDVWRGLHYADIPGFEE